MQGIKVDFITNTIIITKEFAALASDPTSEEYVTLNLVKSENPEMKVVTRTRKKSSSKERNQNKGLPEEHILQRHREPQTCKPTIPQGKIQDL